MKFSKPIFILVAGLFAALAGYAAFYLVSTAKHRSMLKTDRPELAWLKEEFHLDQAEYNRIQTLHDEYLPRCEEMCQKIERANQELSTLLAAENTMTPEIERAMNEASRLRLECQKNMLDHFYKVSRSMPPEQGRRYMDWVRDNALLTPTTMAVHHSSHGRHNP